MDSNPQVNKEKKKSKNRLYIIIILLLLLLCGILTWQFIELKNQVTKEIIIKEQIIVERNTIKDELLQLQADYATLQTNDKALQEELEAKKIQIEELLEQAEKHKDDAYIISKLKKEADTLRKIMKGYIVTIDSLNTLNKNLIVEKEKVKADLTTEQGKTSQLNKEKENLQNVVALGSVLKANSVKATGVRLKSGGKKELDNNKAKRVEKIKVEFTLGENKIAKKGNREIYIRVLTPDGKELSQTNDESSMFKFNGVRGFYAAKETINYSNQEVSLKMYCDKKDGFLPGKYIIEIYSDEADIGQTTLTLE